MAGRIRIRKPVSRRPTRWSPPEGDPDDTPSRQTPRADRDDAHRAVELATRFLHATRNLD